MSDAYYTLHIAGLERQLKRFPVSDSMDIAAFIFFGDVELTKACAEALLKKVPEFDYIVTPEAKSIPLAYEMSRQSGKKYIVARKGVKVYMDRPEKVTVHSITTQKEQTLYLGHEDGDLLDGKRVLLLDDVISTGDSLKALQQLVALFGANIVASAAPAMPISKTKMNSGSSPTFRSPPTHMPYIESVASPSARRTLLSTNDAHMTGAASRMMRA